MALGSSSLERAIHRMKVSAICRIPADEESSLKEWMRLRAALADADLRVKAAER